MDVPTAIQTAPWLWYSYFPDHVEAEVATSGIEKVMLAAPIDGGPVTWSVSPGLANTRGIPWQEWHPSGFAVTGFRRVSDDQEDGDGWYFVEYAAIEVAPH